MADPKNPNADFVHLHLHSDYSLLDGACKCDRLMRQAASLGMPALALTDHGNLFGLIDFYKNARRSGIRPILGCEIYLVIDHNRSERPERSRHKSYHMGLLAKDFSGYQNLTRLVSDAHVNGFYYRPRTDLEHLAAHSGGLIGFTGCLQGVVPQHLIHDDYEGARQWLGRFVEIFGRENYFVELQDHGIPEQQKIIPPLLKLAEEFSLKIVCTNDVHYVERTDHDTHDALLCIQTGSRVSDENRLRYASGQFYLKSAQEMGQLFGERPESLINTRAVAEMCSVELPFGENHYPVFPLPLQFEASHEDRLDQIISQYERLKRRLNGADEEDSAAFAIEPAKREDWRRRGSLLLDLCIEGLQERYGVDYHDPKASESKGVPSEGEARALVERIDYELSIIAGTGFIDYFLIVADFIRWARGKRIPVGPGRGSGAGCLVAYLTGITGIDPIRFGLLFERFLNPERVSPPDFDIDFCMRRRDEVIEYVREKYGKECVANIITFGTFGAKMVVRDIARVLDLPYAEGDRLAKMIPDDLGTTLSTALERSRELRDEVESNPVARQIIEHGRIIEGMVRNTGRHAAGIIIADRPLDAFVPLTVQEGSLTTQFPKDPVEDLGLLKMDFLGLRTLTIVADAEENVRLTADPGFSIEAVSYEDAATFRLLNEGRTVGVFQLESGGMQALCRQFNLSRIDEIVALIALYRPGPMEWIPLYIKGKKDPGSVSFPHPLLEEICRETYGVMVYQEQVMEAARRIAGFTLGGADILRRAMGKKKADVMEQQRARFIEGAREHNNIDAKKAGELFAILEKFAGYGFNKSHSAAYAILGYQTAYLKANYPVQFMAAVLSSELGNADKVAHFIGECVAMSVPVLGPDVNESRHNFTPVVDPAGAHGGKIRFGLAAIKGVGESAAARIIEECESGGPFASFEDFTQRVDGKAVNRRVLECLIKSGAFDSMGEDRGRLLRSLDAALEAAASLQRDRAVGQESFFDLLGGGDSPNGATGAVQPREGNSPEAASAESLPLMEKLQFEKELLGFYVSGHPLDRFAGLDNAIDTFTATRYPELTDQATFRLCAVLSGVQRRISKKNNQPWAILSVGTRAASFSVNVFPEAFAKLGPSLTEGRVVVLFGSVRRRGEEVSLNADRVEDLGPLAESLIRRVTFVLRPDPEETARFLREMRDELEHHQGECRVRFALGLEQVEAPGDDATDPGPEEGGEEEVPLASQPTALFGGSGDGLDDEDEDGRGTPASDEAADLALDLPGRGARPIPAVIAPKRRLRVLLAEPRSSLAWRLIPERFQSLRRDPAVATVRVEAVPNQYEPPPRRFGTRNGQGRTRNGQGRDRKGRA